MTDAVRCQKEIWSGGRYTPTRCERKAVRDGYCTQHHPDSVAKRRNDSEARYKAALESQREARQRPVREAVAARDAAWREAVERVRMLHSASCLRWIRNDESQPCSCDDTTKIHNAALDALLLAMQKGGA